MSTQQDGKRQSNGGEGKKTLKRKMNRGEKASSSKSAAGAKSSSAGGTRTSPGGRGGRPPRRVDDAAGFDADERPGGSRDQVVDKRFFDSFVDDSDVSDLS